MRRVWSAALSLGLIAGVLMVGVVALGVVRADRASAYPDDACQIVVNHQVVHPGDSLRVTGQFFTTADPALAVHWRVTFNHEVVRTTGPTFQHTFAIPDVTKKTVFRLQAEATNGQVSCDPGAEIVASPPDASNNPGSSLPNTGGPRLLFAALGALCLAAGALAVRTGRRRARFGWFV